MDIPKEMTDSFQAGQEVVVKMKQLPILDFLSQIDGKASEVIKFRKGVLISDLDGKEIPIGGKEIPIESFSYDYTQGQGISGAAYMEFQVKDIAGKVGRFRLYDNGFGEPRLTIKMGGGFDTVESFDYDPKVDSLKIEYDHGMDQNPRTTLRFIKPPDNIDLDTHRIPEEMRLRWEEAVKSDNKKEMGNIGEDVAAKIAEEEYDAKVSPKGGETGPDRKIMLDSEHGVLEAKATADKSKLDERLGDAIVQVRGRIKENSEYKVGIAASVYIDKDTGSFEYKHDIVRPNTQDAAFAGLSPIDTSAPDQPSLGLTFTGSSNQSPNTPTQVKEQEQVSKTTNSNSKKASAENSSKTSKAQNDQNQIKFEDREGSGKVNTKQAQQTQQQGQQTKQQGNNATKDENKPVSSDKNNKSDSQHGQQTHQKGSESTKDNEKPAPSNSNNSSKGTKDPGSRNYAPSHRSGAELI